MQDDSLTKSCVAWVTGRGSGRKGEMSLERTSLYEDATQRAVSKEGTSGR